MQRLKGNSEEPKLYPLEFHIYIEQPFSHLRA